MKLIFYMLTAVIMTASAYFHKEKKTVVYIVRHAEKEAGGSMQQDPGLTEVGMQRVEDLTKKLKKEHFDAVFSTSYKRTISTVAPLAQRSGVGVQEYKTEQELADKILTSHKGETILVAGHSNTVMKLISELGAVAPLDELKDDDYDFLFKVELRNGGASVKASHFGSSHHITEIANK